LKPDRFNTSYTFGTGLTQLGRRLLVFYAIVYVSELLLEHWLKVPLVTKLVLHPPVSGQFQIWQVFTHPFIHDPYGPIRFLINGVVFYFFAAQIERHMGSRQFLRLFYVAALGGAVCGLALSGISGFNFPFMGMLPSLLALIVVFGLINADATILLMFVLPVKAKYISYGTVAITLLTFLAKANPNGAYHLGGILCGFIYFKGPTNLVDPQSWYTKYLEWQLKRKKSRFTVIDGKKKDNDKPTYH